MLMSKVLLVKSEAQISSELKSHYNLVRGTLLEADNCRNVSYRWKEEL